MANFAVRLKWNMILSQLVAPLKNVFKDNNRLERIWLLAKIDFSKRYYGSKLGLFWALLNPLLKVGIYFFAFEIIMGGTTIEYFAVYLFAGLIIWLFFTEAVSRSMNLLKSKRYLTSNIQFSWHDLFYSQMVSSLLGFLFNMMAFSIWCLYYGLVPGLTIVFFPILVFNLVLTSLGFAYVFAILKLYLNDIQHIWALLVLAGFWTAPIFFRGQDIAKNLPWLNYVHPGSALIINFRKVIMYGEHPDYSLFFSALVYGLVVWVIGRKIFDIYSVKAIDRI